ncbi:MAG: hypothetical protein JRN58_06615 [Nitrososphaerota archaeon]|nr:hypothetical protein [Nitrososphaerota archaeon]MDG6966931.1 hypothetical protein [Nitrososphaerota archaeon]MDG6978735.1 hypothetical protein [Nitrososphaerota archaeon]
MLEKLMVMTVVVKDQERSPDHYARALGLEKRKGFTGPGGARCLTVAPKGQDIEISLCKAGSYPDGKRGRVQFQLDGHAFIILQPAAKQVR